MENIESKEAWSNMKILKYALSHWKILIGVGIIAGVMAAVFSGPSFITPKFTANAVIYPANLGGYSGETRLEQMQQYLESNAIKDSIIRIFNLYDEYEIDSSAKSSKNLMNKVYSEHINFDETKFESISITATSSDPEKAKEIVDEIINQLDETIRRTERKKYSENLKISEDLLIQKKLQVDSLESKIKTMSTKYGLLDYIAQSERVTEKYLDFLLKGKKGSDFDEAKTLYENLEKYGRMFHNLHAQLNIINEEYINRLNDYEHSLKNLNKYQTYSYVLVEAEVPDKKSSPIRWVIVVMAISVSIFFTFTLLLVTGYNKG